jgi:hypothetical protein
MPDQTTCRIYPPARLTSLEETMRGTKILVLFLNAFGMVFFSVTCPGTKVRGFKFPCYQAPKHGVIQIRLAQPCVLLR